MDALRKHIPALDGIRGIAILLVVFLHSYDQIVGVLRPGMAAAIRSAAESAAFGVDLFFVLSGFLITGALLDSKGAPGYFRNFYARRLLRLFPVYICYLAIAAFVLPPLHRLVHTSIPDYHGNWFWYLLYLSNWKPGNGAHDPLLGHFWSLAVEEQFYLVWAPLVLLLTRRRLGTLCILIIAGALCLRTVLSSADADWNHIYRWTVTRVDTMAFGALVALAVRSRAGLPTLKRWAPTFFAAGLTAFCALAIYAGGTDWNLKPIQTAGSTIAAIAFAGLIGIGVTQPLSRIADALRARWLRYFGKVSYALYVFHIPVMAHMAWLQGWLMHRTSPTYKLPIGIGIFIASNALSVGVATLSWIFLESPILKLKKRFSSEAPISPKPARDLAVADVTG